ncbi:MAG: L-rhamnose mutarotase [Bacteroidia bacterium]|nr:L-rhamnose mutarotase [Bacteroidia bacterium]
MNIFAKTLNLRDDPEAIRQYLAYHAQPWPEVLDALRKVGVKDMRIFILGRRLCMYLTGGVDFDPDRDLPRYLDLHPRCREWEDLMTTLQEPVPEAPDGVKWAPMTEIFCLSAS